MSFIHSQSAGAVLIGPTNQIAVVSENDLTALKRELNEETSITNFKVIKKLGTYKRYAIAKDGGEDLSELKTITFYLCSTDQNVLKPQDPENPEARWVDPDKVADLLTHPKDKQFYSQNLDKIKSFIKSRA
jgi:8-oxo-dGTP pyrophosphatase MutT (NUDIX family)